MAARDGLIARVKPYVSGLSAADVRLITDLAAQHGSGLIDLTSRANLQVRGLSEASAARFADAVAAVGLASADPQAERRRNILIAGDCGPKLLALASTLEAWLESPKAPSLPSKFGFAFTAGEPVDADIVVQGEQAPVIRLAGSLIAASASDSLAALQALTLSFAAQAERLSPPPHRMKALVERMGGATVLEQAGVLERGADVAMSEDAEASAGFDLGVVFGALDSVGLRAVADLAERYGDGRLRLLPGRRLRLGGVPPGAHEELALAAEKAGFLVDPADARLRLRACVGRRGCARTEADVRADALALSPILPAGAVLHVSGCIKGCAHPGAADVTLAATGADRYDLIMGGSAGDRPTARDLPPAQIAQHLQTQHP
jgi:precorrin-3B synthase